MKYRYIDSKAFFEEGQTFKPRQNLPACLSLVPLLAGRKPQTRSRYNNLRNSLWLLAGKKPYTSPDTTTLETACG
jgi:hypothetical protein